jgi:hypothetical protein
MSYRYVYIEHKKLIIMIIVYYYSIMNSYQVYKRQHRKENNLSKWHINNKKNLYKFNRLYK